MSLAQINPFDFFSDTNGDPLDQGYIYVGVANLDPVTNPVSIYYDAAMTIPAPQPLRTVAGYISNPIAPQTFFTNQNYSVSVRDKNQVVLFYVANFSSIVSNTPFALQLAASNAWIAAFQAYTQAWGDNFIATNDAWAANYRATNEAWAAAFQANLIQRYLSFNNRGNWAAGTGYAIQDLVIQGSIAYICLIAHTSGVFATDLANGDWAIYQGATKSELGASNGASLIGFIQSGAGALLRTSQAKMREQWSVKDFGAVGDGTLHTVLEWYTIGATYYRGYANLAAVQVDFTHVTASTDSSDWAAMQQAVRLLPLNTGDPAQTPQGFANGGCVQVTRGRYILNKKVTLQRGTRISGESHESTQFVSTIAADSVFEYLDNGGFVPDEIVLENLSIWQDVSVVATAGAAITVKRGSYASSAIQLIAKNVMIQGTLKGVLMEAGVGCSLDNVTVLKCVSNGIDINFGGSSSFSTTSTTLKNTYCTLNGGNGVNIAGSSYVSLLGTASDSNTGFGYSAIGANGITFLGVGAERNVAGNFYLKDITGGSMSFHQVSGAGAVNGLTLNNVGGLTLISPNFLADVGNIGNAVFFEASAKPLIVFSPTFQNFGTKYSSVNSVLQMNSLNGQIKGGDTNNWTFGPTVSKDTAAQIAVVGNGDVATEIGVKSHVMFTFAGTNRNNAFSAQAITANTAVSYPLLTGLYVANASKGAASTVTRTAGTYIAQQTLGSSANANIMVDAGVGAIPAGNWDIYSDSTRDSVLKGKLRLGAIGGTAPFITGGSGTPEGVLTAPIGSLWMRSDGGANTSLYVKESGAGNTGWVAK